MKLKLIIVATTILGVSICLPGKPSAQEWTDGGVPEEEVPMNSVDGGVTPEPVSDEIGPDAGVNEHIEDTEPVEESAEVPDQMPEKKPAQERTPVNIRGTETFIAEYIGDNGTANESIYGDDDDFWNFRNILYVQAGNKFFDSAIRLDTSLFASPPDRVNSGNFIWGPGASGYTTLNYSNDFRVERIHGTAHMGKLKITVGDSYVNFGRGIALSLIKLDDVGVDNALRGGRVEYRIPRKFKLVLVGGVVNSLNMDPVTHQVQKDDPLDRIAGARAEWEIMDALSLGVHGVFMRPRFTDESEVDPERLNVDQGTGIGVITGGATAQLYLGGLALYLEGNGQAHDNYRPAGQNQDVHDESGYGAFAEISYDLSPFMLKAEGIFYRRWLMEGAFRGSSNAVLEQPMVYNNMVTLEPMWMVIKSFGNAEGGRLTGDLFIKESDTQLTLLFSSIMYEGGLLPGGIWEDHPPTLILHPILKARQNFEKTGISLALEGGFRHEKTDEPDAGHPDTGHLWHVLGDLTIPLTGPHSLELKAELRRHELHVTEGMEYWITMESLGYEMSGLFGITVVHEYSDQTLGADNMIGDWTIPLPHRHYMWGLLSFHMPEPLDGLTLRLFAGSQRGGIKCAGGVCRLYPDAVGAKLEAVYRF